MELAGTDWVTCPYDPSHSMKYSKFHNHFVKCQKAHPNDPREPCPYFASELIHPDDMKKHMESCKHRTLYRQSVFEVTDLPVYIAPCNVKLSTNSDSDEEDEDVKSMVTEKTIRDDRSSLISAKYSIHSLKSAKKLFLEFADDTDSENENSVVVGIAHNLAKIKPVKNEQNVSELNRIVENGIRNMSVSKERNHTSIVAGGIGRGRMIQELLRSRNSTPISEVSGKLSHNRGLGRATLLKSRFSPSPF